MDNPLLAVVAEGVVELRNDMISVLHELRRISKRIDELLTELEEAKDER